MKAIQISRTGGPDVLDYVDVPTPSPGPGEVLVKAEAIGVNYFDTMIRTGRYRWMPKLPFVLGNEMSGHVAALGAGRDDAQGRPAGVHRRLRDRQPRRALRANTPRCRRRRRGPLPAGVDADEATALTNYQLAWILLHHAARGVDAENRRGLWRGRRRRLGADRRGAARRRDA